ncbi:hypothetical protein ACNO8X_18120 [Mycobacterium sp. PDNC021]|uniref:hypothetical protein n=1 Tax=Mycobacterium sp. PDNC021 TaxID=3391399 RepID=UPI003AAE4166
MRSSLTSREHFGRCIFKCPTYIFNDLCSLIDLIFRLYNSRFGAEYLSRSRVHSGTCIPIRPEDAGSRRRRKPASLALPVSQFHPLMCVMRNQLAIEMITQRHKPITDVVEHRLIDIRKRSTDDSLPTVIALAGRSIRLTRFITRIALNLWHRTLTFRQSR